MCGCWNKWRGATRGPRGRGRAQGGVRALDPRGQVLAPPDMFSVPDILKNSRKKIAINKVLEQKLIGPIEESHIEEQSPKAVL